MADPSTSDDRAEAAQDAGEFVPVSAETVRAVIALIADGQDHDERLRAAAYERGRQAHLSGGYDAGFALGHDTGSSARQDTRGYVHGILDGFQTGTEQRKQLVDALLQRARARHIASRQPDREAAS